MQRVSAKIDLSRFHPQDRNQALSRSSKCFLIPGPSAKRIGRFAPQFDPGDLISIQFERLAKSSQSKPATLEPKSMNKEPSRNQTQLPVEMLGQPARLGDDTGLRLHVFDPLREKRGTKCFPANDWNGANLQQRQSKEGEFLAWIKRQKNLVARLDSFFP